MTQIIYAAIFGIVLGFIFQWGYNEGELEAGLVFKQELDLIMDRDCNYFDGLQLGPIAVPNIPGEIKE